MQELTIDCDISMAEYMKFVSLCGVAHVMCYYDFVNVKVSTINKAMVEEAIANLENYEGRCKEAFLARQESGI